MCVGRWLLWFIWLRKVSLSVVVFESKKVEPRKADEISNAFIVAQRKVLLRFEQGTSYYSTFPWSIVRLLGYIVEPAGQEREHAVHQSRTFAVELCQMFDAGQLNVNNFAGDFSEGRCWHHCVHGLRVETRQCPKTCFEKPLRTG